MLDAVRDMLRDKSLTQERKADHVRICLNGQVEFQTKRTGLERYEFVHQALPEINKSEIDISTKLFGKILDAPIIIEAMTGYGEGSGLWNLEGSRA